MNLAVFFFCVLSAALVCIFSTILADPCLSAPSGTAALLTGHTRDEWHPNMEYICPTSMIVVVNGRAMNTTSHFWTSPASRAIF